MKDPNYWTDKYWPILRKRLSRRRIIQLSALGTLGAITAATVGCGDDDENGSPTAGPASPAATGTPAGTAAAGNALNEIFGPGGAAAGQGKTIQLGAILSLSGSGSYYGQVNSKGTDLGVKHVKEAGGPDIKVSYKDHKSGDIPSGVEAARALALETKAPVIFTSYFGVLGGVLPAIEQYKILTLDPGAGVTGAFTGKPYFWGTRALLPDDTYPGIAKYFSENFPDTKRVVLLAQGSPEYADAQKASLTTTVTAHGMEVVAAENLGFGVTDFSTTIARLEGQDPDLIVALLAGLDPGYFMKQYVSAGLKAPVVGTEFTPDAANVAGDSYDEYYFAYDYFDAENPINPWSKIFVDAYREEYGEVPDVYSANYYEGVFLLWDLAKRILAKNGDLTSGDAFQQELMDNPTFKSLYGGDASTVGEMTFDLTSHETSKTMVLGKGNAGKAQILAKFDREGKIEGA